MPTNREKRPRWLMICKCGATVKASARKDEITPFGAVRALRVENMAAGATGTDRSHVLSGPLPSQEFGTIEGRSKGVTIPYGGAWRASARWNNIRRSKALERMMGKRA